MSELRIVKFSEMNAIKLGLRNDELYFKSEVDKVLEEKDKEIRKLNFQLWSARFEAAEAKCDGPRMASCQYMADKYKEVK